MNNTARPFRSTPNSARPLTRPKPTAVVAPHEVADLLNTEEDARWLARLALAVTAGLTVVSPRSALLVADLLGPSRLRSTSPSTDQWAEPRSARDPRLDA
jgi:hypothetical protein